MAERDHDGRDGTEDTATDDALDEAADTIDEQTTDKEGPGASKMENLRRIDERLSRQRRRVEQTDPTLPDD